MSLRHALDKYYGALRTWKAGYVLLNLFPYNSGHLLVCPYRHVSTYDLATDEEVAEIGSLTQSAMRPWFMPMLKPSLPAE